MTSPDLLHHYLSTEYRVTDPPLVIRIRHLHTELDKLLQDYKCTDWAYITASNPASIVLPDNENMARHQMLGEDLKGYLCFEGYGVGKDPEWKPERSLLVVGIDQDAAKALGNKYGQNAIVAGMIGEVAELICLV